MLVFTILSIFNVILSTIRSLATIKCGKLVASIVNAVYYGYYTVVLVFTVCDDIPLWLRVLICFACNLVGVFIVKLIEEKMRKDRLWRVEFTVNNIREDKQEVCDCLDFSLVPYNTLDIGKDSVFTCYCSTQEQSTKIKEIINKFNGKYFVSESKVL